LSDWLAPAHRRKHPPEAAALCLAGAVFCRLALAIPKPLKGVQGALARARASF
jgi:hypothetical protein